MQRRGSITYTKKMPPRHDIEGVMPDERAPLLQHADVRQRTPTPSECDDTIDEPQKATSRTWFYVWRSLLALFVILVVVVFVKGWIDADDVDVCIPQSRNSQPRKAYSMRHSSISKAR